MRVRPVKKRCRRASSSRSCFAPSADALDVHAAVAAEAEAAQPAVGGDVLVLLADRLAEALDLDLARLARELLGGHLLAAVDVEGVQESDREAARGAEARALRRDVGEQRHLDAALDARHAHRLADQLVLDLRDVRADLLLHVVEVDLVVEALLHDHVDVLVDRGGDDEALALGVVGRQVGAAARERDAQRGLRDDHAALPRASKSLQACR